MATIRYCIVTPARNEGKFLSQSIDSVVAQTCRPTRWIIVDDGSSDDTGAVADAAAIMYDWISVVHRKDRGSRQAGGGVVEAFLDGFKLLKEVSWDFVVKLDGDVTFESDCFERCFVRFAEDPKLGIGGGLISNLIHGNLQPESKADPAFHVRGATKIYRRECWDAIGGLVAAVGWDTIDELKANMLGWTSLTFKDVPMLHHRPAGAAYGTWANWVKNGRANFVTGYHPIFMLVKCLSRVFKKPYAVGGLGLAVGFFGSYLKGLPRIDDVEMVRFLRHEQMKRLFLQKNLWS